MGLLLGVPLWAPAATLYVDLNSPSPTAPYASWATSATNIQDAIEAAVDGDLVLVTNGVYGTGGKMKFGDLTNRVALDKAITVQSVNGPWFTMIRGNGATNGLNAVRCAWITNGARLEGFTLTAGATRTSGDQTNLLNGGGALCLGVDVKLFNCLVISNSAQSFGGGVFQGQVVNSAIVGNRSQAGSGVAFARLQNCSVVSNWLGVATVQSAHTNSIIYYNTPINYSGGSFGYSCTTPIAPSAGNITNAPQLATDTIHLLSTSPCMGAGGNFATGTDLDGHPWRNPPAMGCDEGSPFPTLGLSPFRFETWGMASASVTVTGQPPLRYQCIKDGQLVSEGEINVLRTNIPLRLQPLDAAHAGNYYFVLSNAFGVVTSQVAPLTIRCVDLNSPAAVPPYATWTTAATNIQDAVEAAQPGDLILVATGIYGRGGKAMAENLTNRVALDKPVTLMSVYGPSATIIQGAWDLVATNGPGAVRGVWMADGAALVGFTVRGGATRTGGTVINNSGGGIWCNSTNARVVGCVIEVCAAAGGAGVLRGTIINSLIRNNIGFFGVGGVSAATLINCTVTENKGSHSIGGIESCKAFNSISWGNRALVIGAFVEHQSSSITNSCTTPLPAGAGNISADPRFEADGFHLQAGSPCLNAGSSSFVSGVDLDGQPWSASPSMGCDERLLQLAVGQPAIVPTGDGKIRLRVSPIGAAPEDYWWFKDGIVLANDARISGAQSAELVIRSIDPADAGFYHAVVTNNFGSVTSAVVQIRPHFVNASSLTPAPPYTNWSAAAATIQDAIDAANHGDLIVVADGIYGIGGKVISEDLTNRVVLNKAVMVTSLEGPTNAIIEGQRDLFGPNGNGNSAVRAVAITDWAKLAGFTIRNGATRTNGNVVMSQSGGGIWAVGDGSLVIGCVVTNNSAHQNGGGAFGASLERCELRGNTATNGGGIYGGHTIYSYLTENRAWGSPQFAGGGGAYGATLRNSVIHKNFAFHNGGVNGCAVYNCSVTENDGHGIFFGSAYNTISWGNKGRDYSGSLYLNYSCANFAVGSYGTNNLFVDPQLVDAFHLSENSPVRGAGGPLFVTGTDFDGDPWSSPVSMGADEFVADAITGSLSVSIELPAAPVYPNRLVPLVGRINGRAARIEWSFGEGPVVTNVSYATRHAWTTPGNYPIIFTAFNAANPAGVSTSVVLPVIAVPPSGWASIENLGGYYRFFINTEIGVTNTIEFATNLTAPVLWLPLKTTWATNVLMREFDVTATNASRFYRLRSE